MACLPLSFPHWERISPGDNNSRAFPHLLHFESRKLKHPEEALRQRYKSWVKKLSLCMRYVCQSAEDPEVCERSRVRPWWYLICLSVQFSLSVLSNSLQPHGLCHTGPSPIPRVYSNSCPLSQWCHPSILSSVIPFSSCLQSFPASESFPMSLCIMWPKHWSLSFSISPSNEYSGLTSFRVNWLDLLARDSQESSPTPQFKSINSLVFSFLYGPTLTSIHTWPLEKP